MCEVIFTTRTHMCIYLFTEHRLMPGALFNAPESFVNRQSQHEVAAPLGLASRGSGPRPSRPSSFDTLSAPLLFSAVPSHRGSSRRKRRSASLLQSSLTPRRHALQALPPGQRPKHHFAVWRSAAKSGTSAASSTDSTSATLRYCNPVVVCGPVAP